MTGETSYAVTAEELQQFIEQYQQLDSEKKTVSEAQKELMDELSGRGYDKKIFRKIILLLKKSADDRAEEDAILQLYKSALGIE